MYLELFDGKIKRKSLKQENKSIFVGGGKYSQLNKQEVKSEERKVKNKKCKNICLLVYKYIPLQTYSLIEKDEIK